MKTIGIIGGGNMGTAIINGIRKKYKVIVCEKDKKRSVLLRRKFKIAVKDLKSVVLVSDIIILAVKPQDSDRVLKEIRSNITCVGARSRAPLLVSIAAGLTCAFIEKGLGNKVRVVRTMPNMPVQIGEGITAICKGKYAKKSDLDAACRVFNSLGKTVIVKESAIDAVTAVSGSGPAYVFLFAECLMKAAQSLGLNSALSKELVKNTLSGSIHLLEKQNQEAAVLRAKVTSKGGTTQAAMDVFMKNKINQVFKKALSAAKQRARKLSRR